MDEPTLHGLEPPAHGAVVALPGHLHEDAPRAAGGRGGSCRSTPRPEDPAEGLRERPLLRPRRAPPPSPPPPRPLRARRSTPHGTRRSISGSRSSRSRSPRGGPGAASGAVRHRPSPTPPPRGRACAPREAAGSKRARRSSGALLEELDRARSSAARASADGAAVPFPRAGSLGHGEEGTAVPPRDRARGCLHATTSKTFGAS